MSSLHWVEQTVLTKVSLASEVPPVKGGKHDHAPLINKESGSREGDEAQQSPSEAEQSQTPWPSLLVHPPHNSLEELNTTKLSKFPWYQECPFSCSSKEKDTWCRCPVLPAYMWANIKSLTLKHASKMKFYIPVFYWDCSESSGNESSRESWFFHSPEPNSLEFHCLLTIAKFAMGAFARITKPHPHESPKQHFTSEHHRLTNPDDWGIEIVSRLFRETHRTSIPMDWFGYDGAYRIIRTNGPFTTQWLPMYFLRTFSLLQS